MIVKATFVSVWNGVEIRTSCNYNTETRFANNIEASDANVGNASLDEEFIELEDGTKIPTMSEELYEELSEDEKLKNSYY